MTKNCVFFNKSHSSPS